MTTLSLEARAFLDRMGWGMAKPSPVAGDASARSYTRLHLSDDYSAVLMQTPKSEIKGQAAFRYVAAYLRGLGLSAPTVFGEDVDAGFLLVEDFGDQTYSAILDQGLTHEVELYHTAHDLLAVLARTGAMGGLPILAAAELARLTAVTFEELPEDHALKSEQAAFQNELQGLATWILRGVPVTVLRDFHAGNLIWLPDRTGLQRAGVIDFQDALCGPKGYDLVSLIDDARRDLSLELRTTLIRDHAHILNISEDDMILRTSLLSLQRNFRILGLFRRLARTGKPEYLRHMPRVAAHILRALDHPTLAPLATTARAICAHYLQSTADHAPRGAMIMAAGFGTRMGALTKTTPKPLLRVAGRTLIDHALDVARAGHAAPCVINTHYHANQMRHHLRNAEVILSEEQPEILESGGGIRHALRYFSDTAIFTLNSDNVWTGPNPFATLSAAWRPTEMDALMLLVPRDKATGRQGDGDLGLDATGRVLFDDPQKPYVFTGAQILKTAPIAAMDIPKFGLRMLWETLAQEGRLFGVIHQGGWVDVGHPEGIASAEELLATEKVAVT